MSIALDQSAAATLPQSSPGWLKRYDASRALFSVAWVVLAFTAGQSRPLVGAFLLVAYPLWDCLATLSMRRATAGRAPIPRRC